jgi:hypothetical protein
VTPDAGLARVGLTLESGLGDRLLAAPLAAGTDVVFDVDAVAIASAYCLTIEGRCRSSAGHASACDRAEQHGDNEEKTSLPESAIVRRKADACLEALCR